MALKPNADGTPPDLMSVYGAVNAYKQSQMSGSNGYSGSTPVGSYSGPPSSGMDAYSKYRLNGQPLPAGFVPSDLQTYMGDTLSAPAMASLRAAAAATGIDPWQYISQGYRSYAQQVGANARKPNLAASPGYSMHQLGLAMDTQGLPSVLSQWLLNNGWYQFNAAKEPWHYSYNWVG
jgi:hypothetical protein